MKSITINPHNCSREEYQELLAYLDEKCWDYSIEEEVEDDSKFSLRENAILSLIGGGRTEINEEIFNQEEFEYKIVDRLDFIDTLIGWIGEARSTDKEMMKQDLFMLQEWDDEYIFSSISTNEYVRQGDSNFNELCEELLELNKAKEEA